MRAVPHAGNVVGFTLVGDQSVLMNFVEGSQPDTIVLRKGTDTEVAVIWKDAAGDVVAVDEDAGYSFSIRSSDESLVSFAPSPSPDPWVGILSGNAAGRTTIRVRLMHDGHEDFGADVPIASLSAIPVGQKGL